MCWIITIKKRIYGGIRCRNIMNLRCVVIILYYTASCVIEAMHVHASDRKINRGRFSKILCKSDGDTTIEKQGQLNEREVREIRKFIKKNYKEMYLKWQQLANTGYYGE